MNYDRMVHAKTRVKEVESTLERYVIDNMVQIVDEARYWLKISSMTTLTLWYNASLQCFFMIAKTLQVNLSIY